MKFITLIIVYFLTVFAITAQIPYYIPTNGLAGYWPFTGNANDESGNGVNGTAVNGAGLTTDRYGNSNRAYSFDGVNDYIRLSKGLLNGSSNVSNVTFACWMLPDGNQVSANWQILGLSGSYPRPEILIGNSPEYFIYSFGRDLVLGDPNLFSPGNWQHLVCTFENGVWKIYINGAFYAERIESPQSLNFSYVRQNGVDPYVWFGAFRGGNLNPYKVFDGKLDEIVIWNRTLSLWEIQNIYIQSCSICEFPSVSNSIDNCEKPPKRIPF